MKTQSHFLEATSPTVMQNSHIVGIGCGGASGLYAQLVRSGIGKLTLYDIDKVETKNLTRQSFFPTDVGVSKVEAIKTFLLRINPDMEINIYHENVLELPFSEIKNRFKQVDGLLLMTDRFLPQAFGNLLALYFQIPTIWAGYYAGSQCLELFFSHPEFSTSCFRCCMSSRYEVNKTKLVEVSSIGNTIFHSELLNAQIGMILIALLHHGVEGFGFSGWFEKPCQKVFYHHKIHPDYTNIVFQRIKHPNHGFCFQSAWQAIEPECPPKHIPCPDCGGIGDLASVNKEEVARKIAGFQQNYQNRIKK